MYAGQVADNNAKVAGQNADYAKKAGAQEAINERMEGAARGARIANTQAASGVDVGSGASRRVRRSQQIVNEHDVETILHNADLSAYGYTTQQTGFKDQAAQSRAAGFWGAGSTLLEGASSVTGSWRPTPAGGSAGNSWTAARERVGYAGA